MKKEVVTSFTLLQVSFIDVDGLQHAVNAQHLDSYVGDALARRPDVESIPWSELVGRTVNSVWMQDGKLVLGLLTKE